MAVLNGGSEGICRISDVSRKKDVKYPSLRRIFDVILQLTSLILDYMEKRKIIKVNGKLGLGSDQVALKSQVSSARSFLAVLVFLLMFQLMSCECFLVVYIYIYIYI